MTESERFQRVLESISEFFAMDDPRSSFNRVLRDLMDCCPDAVIVGGIAVSFFVNHPRATEDVDIVLLDDTFMTDRFRDRFEALPGKPFSVRHKETGIEVDVLNVENPVLNRRLLVAVTSHVRLMNQAGTVVRVAAPEMIIGLKLHRALNMTPKGLIDRSDILSILTANPELDLSPIKEYLSEEELDLLDDLVIYREKLLTGEIHD